jgi:ribonuclease P/MRP protein subunit RPP40
MKNYHSNRIQYTYYNGSNSSKQPVTHGIPQGSILGPILFLLYVNDLQNALQQNASVLFADDTTLTYTGPSLSLLSAQINNDMAALSECGF